jgi:hypothetical protein
MPHRHPILYDVQRWRRNRLWLLLPGAACVLVVVLIDALRPAEQQTAAIWTVVGSLLLALAAVYWLRQRYSYLRVDGDDLRVRSLPLGARVPLRDVRAVRTAPMRAAYSTPARQRLLPRVSVFKPGTEWLDVEAVMVRLDREVDTASLVRALHRRCLVGNELVVPVDDPAGLRAEIEAASPALAPQRAARRRR